MINSFKSAVEFRKWLAQHHASSDGIWLRIFKKNSGKDAVTYAEALDEALCYGWIDAQKKAYDEISWLQRFTRRKPKSNWSKINTQHAQRLIKARRMKAAGLKVIEAAKKDGRWKSAYDSPKNSSVPEDFLKALGTDKQAKAFFETLNKQNLYVIAYRLQTAKKPETRERRMKIILEMLRRKEKFHG
jgi:uncharacterized protein YdeI (YjbR/CyaY-like superfamily)